MNKAIIDYVKNLESGLPAPLSPGLSSLLSRFLELPVHERSAMLLFLCGGWMATLNLEELRPSSPWSLALEDIATTFMDCTNFAASAADTLKANGDDGMVFPE